MEKAFNTIERRRGQGRDADEPWTAAERRGARQAHARRRGSTALDASPLVQGRPRTRMMTADNGVRHRVAELSRQPRDGQGRRPREVLDRQRGLSLPGRQPAARAQAGRRPSAPTQGAHADARSASIAVTDTGVRVTLANGKVLEGRARRRSTAPPSVWNRIAIDPALPPALAPQMGTNVKCLMALNGPFWRRAELAPGHADRRPGQLRRGTAPTASRGAGAALVRVLGRHRRRHVPRVAAGRAHRELPRRAAEGLQGHPSELRARRASWTGRRIRGRRRRTRSPRPARSRRRGRCCGRASAACTSPASTRATRSWATWKARSIPARRSRDASP